MSLAFGLCSVPASAQAQQPAADPATGNAAPAQNTGTDSQIVITAQKRSENVQRVPISVAAFSGQTLAKSNISDISQIGKLRPDPSAWALGQASRAAGRAPAAVAIYPSDTSSQPRTWRENESSWRGVEKSPAQHL